MPTIDLSDDELAAMTAAIRRVIEGDRYPRAPRLDALRAALARLEAAAVVGESVQIWTHCTRRPRRQPKPPSRPVPQKLPPRRPRRRSLPASSWAGCRPTADHESRLSAPYLTRHRSWMPCDFAFGQLASTCRSSGNFIIGLQSVLPPVPRPQGGRRARGTGGKDARAPYVARAHALPARGSARRTTGYVARPPAALGHPPFVGNSAAHAAVR